MSSLATTALIFLLWFPPTCRSMSIPYEREVFSVAPMMGHTNRHYHTFFRKLSKRAHLFTEMMPASQIVNLFDSNQVALEELLRINPDAHPIVLQLGGRDPDTLARAAVIGANFGYDGINLNCGCPSDAVSGRHGGASLMLDPSHVARIVERISTALEEYTHVELSIKHRLGVAQAAEYDAVYDRRQDDSVSCEACLKFASVVTFNGSVKKLHVHGRLALLGDFEPESSTPLWIPREHEKGSEYKVDHKRVQYHAKRKSRLATIKNRSVPPLRPTVVNYLANAMPSVEFVSNGGIGTMEDIRDRLDRAAPNLVGAMVGRAAINHPCSFAMVDTLWGEELLDVPTRGKVLEDFADYCEQEESRLLLLGRPPSFMEALRRRLVAVPFALFAGEEGNDVFQRRIRKLISRPGRHSSRNVLLAALAEVPPTALHRSVSEYSLEIESYSEYTHRSGPLQRSIL